MASFKDIIPQFTPYVQQLPVEDMVRVGMQKQQLYDQGVQKIQSQIDTIAGLEVYKDSDKKYLQSKLNELGNNLKTVAAGDFSNFQLVNSVSGMTAQIVKDSNVQSALYSSSHIKKQNAAMEEARKKGTLHPNNEKYYNYFLNEYLNNDQVGQKFSTTYTEYTDYMKKWREVLKEADITDVTTDSPYVTVDGKVQFDSKGQPIVNDYMLRTITKGKDPEKIKKMLMASMDDRDYQQMKIDAFVQYNDYDKDKLVEISNNKFEKNQKEISDTIENLTILRNNNASDKDVVDKLNEQIKALKDTFEKNKTNQPELINQIINNPQAAREQLFVNDSLNNFANAFSVINISKQVVDNPIKKQMNEDRDYKLKVDTFKKQNEQFMLDYQQKRDQFQLNYDRNVTNDAFNKAIKLYQLGLGPNPVGGGGQSKYVGAAETDEEILSGIAKSIEMEASVNDLTNKQNELKAKWMKVRKRDPDIKDPNKAFINLLAEYKKDPNSKDISAFERPILEQYVEAENKQKMQLNIVSYAKSAAEDAVKSEQKALDDDLRKEKGVGSFSAKELIRLKERVQKFVTVNTSNAPTSGRYANVGGVDKGVSYKFDDANARRLLSKEEFYYYTAYKNNLTGRGNSDYWRNVINKSSEISNKVSERLSKINATKNNVYAKTLYDNLNTALPVSSSLPDNFASKFTPLIENKLALEQKNKSELGSFKADQLKNFDIDLVRDLSLNKGTKVTYTEYGDDIYVTMSGKVKDGTTTQTFKVSRDEFNNIVPNVISKDPERNFNIIAAANGSTNYKYSTPESAQLNVEDAFATARYTNTLTKKYTVKGDVFFDPNDKNSTIPLLYIKDNRTKKIIATPDYVSGTLDGSKDSILTLTDAYIDRLLKKQ